MASKQKRQESSERFYVEAFLKMNDLPYEIEEDRIEPRIPDFVLKTPEDTTGLEVTYLFKDETAGGSPHRKRESVEEVVFDILRSRR